MKRILILMLLLFPALAFSQEIENYLILNNIGEYIFRPKRVITIQNAGILVPTGHFPGHGDMTYEGIYIHPQTYIGWRLKSPSTLALIQTSGCCMRWRVVLEEEKKKVGLVKDCMKALPLEK